MIVVIWKCGRCQTTETVEVEAPDGNLDIWHPDGWGYSYEALVNLCPTCTAAAMQDFLKNNPGAILV